MKTLQYYGFTNKLCACDYLVAELDGQSVVVFKNGPLTQTSITNMIEVLASKVLANDLQGVDPHQVRFFEYYPPELQPLRVWQEVKFEEAYPLTVKTGLLTKLLQAVFPDESKPVWAVDVPVWQSVGDELRQRLERLVR